MLSRVSKLAVVGLVAAMALPTVHVELAQAGHRWHGGGGHHHHHYHYRGSGGSAFAAGVVGLAAGAIIGSAVAQPRVYAAPPPRVVYYEPAPVTYLPAPWTPDWYAYCASKYPTFDTRSGTYVSWNGVRRYCH